MWVSALVVALAAASSTGPDPASVTLPPLALSADAATIHDGYKFYFFHNPAASFAEAVEDFRECRGYLATGAPVSVPGFVPFGEAHRKEAANGMSPYGVMGAAVLAVIEPKLERGARSNKLRRCMGTRGYVRYPIPGATFDLLNSGDEETIILRQAKLATSPKPNLPEVPE